MWPGCYVRLDYVAYYPDICVLYIRENQDDIAEEHFCTTRILHSHYHDDAMVMYISENQDDVAEVLSQHAAIHVGGYILASVACHLLRIPSVPGNYCPLSNSIWQL